MHAKVFLVLLLLAFTFQDSSPAVIGVVTGQGTGPLAGVEVRLIGGGHAVSTSTGQFRLRVPTLRVGQRVSLVASKPGWRVLDERDLAVIIPEDAVENPIRITMGRETAARTRPVHNIVVNYMRLFGSDQVPHFLSNQYKAIYGRPDEDVMWHTFNAEGQTMQEFWRTWQYSQARPLRTSLWDACITKMNGNVGPLSDAIFADDNAPDSWSSCN